MDPRYEQLEQLVKELQREVEDLKRDRVDALHTHNGADSVPVLFSSLKGEGTGGRYYNLPFAGIITLESEGTGGTLSKFYITGYNGNADPALQITASEAGVGFIDIGGAIKPDGTTVYSTNETDIGAVSGANDTYMAVFPTYASFESTSANFRVHLPNLGSNPTVGAIGDLAVVNGVLKICTAATPTWTVVGTQT
jgi:hypothetical protein